MPILELGMIDEHMEKIAAKRNACDHDYHVTVTIIVKCPKCGKIRDNMTITRKEDGTHELV